MPASRRRPLEDPFAPLLAYFARRFELKPEHEQLVRSMCVPRSVARGEILQRAGEPASHSVFVSRGLLRSYVIDPDGREHILRFAPEDYWLGDPEAGRTGGLSTKFYAAIEPSDVVVVSWTAHQRMIDEIPGQAAAFATGVQRWGATRERWIIASLSASAEERYRDFLATYPTIASRVPQHMIASYLGLAPETLSRVRRLIAARSRTR